MDKAKSRTLVRLMTGVGIAAVLVGAAPAFAESGAHSYDIPSQNLAKALKSYSATSNVQVLFDGSLARQKKSHALVGKYSDNDALGIMLQDTGLTYDASSPGVILIRGGARAAEDSAARPAAAEVVAPAASNDSQVVVVTGSRLATKGYKAPSPVTVLDAQELKLSGNQNVETTLVQSPQFVGNLYNAAGNGQAQGIAALNLRGLGERRSLTLVNGRRFTITGTANLTDLNTIPSALVKRVEIVTGGSSAVYGSDALAGVVNFIMRDDFKGAEINAQTRWDEHTGTPTSSIDLTLGGNFSEGKGNAVLSLDYQDRGAIFRSQFPWAAVGLSDSCVTAASFNAQGPSTALAVPSGQTCTGVGGVPGFIATNSATIPGGRFTGVPLYNAAGNSTGMNAALLAAGLQNMTSFGFTFDPNSTTARAALDPADRYNNTPLNLMQLPLRRWMLNGFAHYDINSHATAYLEGHYSNYFTDVQIAPLALTTNLLININNPYLSAADQEVLHQLDLAETATTTVSAGLTNYTNAPNDGKAVITANRRFAEGGPGRATTERNVFRTVAGLKGNLTGDLNYDIYYSYAHTQQTDSQTAAISRSKLQAAVLSQGSAAPVMNIFGPNITSAAYAAITVPSTNITTNEQQVLAGNLSGSVFHLPAGAVDFNTGFEWRYNKLDVKPDAMGTIGESVNPNGIPPAVTGSTTVKEAYIEVRVPILADLPFAERLAINGAARYSEYNTSGVGGVWTHSLGVQWQPMHDLSIRAQSQLAIRAPGVDELFSPQAQPTPVVNDPCSNRVATSLQTADVKALCIATGVPTANVFGGAVQPNAQIGTLTGGNPNVGPETADTLTLGAVYTPSQVPGLALSVDWYKIKLDGAISSLGGNLSNTFNLCYYIIKDANSPYCKAIHRDPSSGELTPSNIVDPYYVDQFFANTGGIKTSGIDFNGQYGWNLDYSPFGGPSRLDVSTSWSYTSEYTFIPVQALPLEQECVGSYGITCGQPAPKWKGVTRVTWRNGPVTLSVHDRYTGQVIKDTYLLPVRQGLTAPALQDVSAGKVDGIHYIDLSFSVSLPAQTEVYGGITNLFDKDPPILGSGAQTWGLGTAPGVYEIYGRSYFVGIKKLF